MLLKIKDIYKTYRKGRVKANDGISLSVEKGDSDFSDRTGPEKPPWLSRSLVW